MYLYDIKASFSLFCRFSLPSFLSRISKWRYMNHLTSFHLLLIAMIAITVRIVSPTDKPISDFSQVGSSFPKHSNPSNFNIDVPLLHFTRSRSLLDSLNVISQSFIQIVSQLQIKGLWDNPISIRESICLIAFGNVWMLLLVRFKVWIFPVAKVFKKFSDTVLILPFFKFKPRMFLR